MINESKLNNRMFHLIESGFFGKQVLSEAVEDKEEIKQGAYGDPYQYKRVPGSGGVKYFYAKKGDSNWVEQTKQKGIDGIKQLIFPKDLETGNTSKETKDTSSETGNTSKETQVASDNANKKYEAIFVAGITSGISIDNQIKNFKAGFGEGRRVAVFYYDGAPYGHKQSISQVLAESPKIPIFLYSAGADQVYNMASNANADVNKIFVIEPYFGPKQTIKPKIDAAINMGVPVSHIYVGGYAEVGLGVVEKATPTKSGNHFKAPAEVAALHKNA
jgi:hypothetical protein